MEANEAEGLKAVVLRCGRGRLRGGCDAVPCCPRCFGLSGCLLSAAQQQAHQCMPSQPP